MTLKLSRRSGIAPFIVMQVMRAASERVASGDDVVHMEVGQPSSGAPRGAVEALKRAVDAGPLGYTDALGNPELRRRIARHYGDSYGVDVPWQRIAVTTGSSAAFLLSFLAAFDPGDRVVLTDPSYPCYRNILAALGVEAVHVPVGPDTRFQPTPEILERIPGRVDGLIVASPSNPTGSMIRPGEMAALTACCRERGIRLISDEIYHGITYGEAAATALATTQDAVVINSFSKYFSMTGWRLGWMVVPERLLPLCEKLAQNFFISPPALSQHAAVAAFDCREEIEANIAVYARNRDLLLREFPKLGLSRLAAADGAFYIYADVRDYTNDSVDFCRRMLAETGIAATPGVDFDPHRGHVYVRFSFAGTTEAMERAVAALKSWPVLKAR